MTHVFTTRHYQCVSCRGKQSILAWDYDPVPACQCGGRLESAYTPVQVHAVIDDQLEGGPRRFETMGHDAPYIETKSQWRREMEKRGLINAVRHDAAYHAKQRKMHDEKLRDTGSPY